MSESTLRQLKLNIVYILEEEIRPLFKSRMKLTFIAHDPSNEENEVVISEGTLEELETVIARTKERKDV